MTITCSTHTRACGSVTDSPARPHGLPGPLTGAVKGGSCVLSNAQCEDIAASEVRRFGGRLPGYQREDLLQEARIAVFLALRKCDGRAHGSRTFLRRAARNRLSNLLRSATTFRACPHDAWGRPQPHWFSDTDRVSLDSGSQTPAEALERKQQVALLRDRLDPRDWQLLVDAYVQGAESVRSGNPELIAVCQTAAQVLSRFHYRVLNEEEAPQMSTAETNIEDLSECHADGIAPQGYDVSDTECTMCPDKFTCLPRAIAKKLRPGPLSIDSEVEAVEEGLVTREAMITRMRRRSGLMKMNEEIPADLRHDDPSLLDKPAAKPKAAPKAPEAEAKPKAKTNGQSGPAKPAPETEAPAEEAKAAPAPKAEKPAPKAKPKAEKPKPAAAKPKAEKPAPKAKPKSEPKPKPVAEAKTAKLKKAPKKAPNTAAVLSVEAIENAEAKGGIGYQVKCSGKAFDLFETADGWGWWARKGSAESEEWLDTYAQALRDVAGHLETVTGDKIDRGEHARKAPKPAQKRSKAKAKVGSQRGRKGTPGRPSPVPDTWPRMRDERIYPQPVTLTEEEMIQKLKETRVSIGSNRPLEFGYKIVRRLRTGERVVATIERQGFRYNLPADLAKQAGLKRSQLFGSLSSIAMWADGRLRTGGDYFNIAKHSCTEILDENNRIVDRKGGVPDWE